MSGPRRPVLVAYDGTDEARAALLWALQETAPDGPILPVAVLGAEPSPLPLLSRLSRPDDIDRAARRIATAWDDDGADLRDVVELRFAHGHPAERLAEIAAEEDADMIVLGHHRGRRAEHLRPSVARDLMALAPCPVVLVP